MHLYEHISCPTPLHIERYTKSLYLETFYSHGSWVFRWTLNWRITLKRRLGSIGFGQPVFTDCDLFHTFKVNQGAKYIKTMHCFDLLELNVFTIGIGLIKEINGLKGREFLACVHECVPI